MVDISVNAGLNVNFIWWLYFPRVFSPAGLSHLLVITDKSSWDLNARDGVVRSHSQLLIFKHLLKGLQPSLHTLIVHIRIGSGPLNF